MSEFVQGYACAVSCIVQGHGINTAVREALEACGLTTMKKLKDAGVVEYDLEILKPLITEIKNNQIRRRK